MSLTRFIFVIPIGLFIGMISSLAAATEYVDIRVRYEYAGQPQVPSKKTPFCLDVSSEQKLSQKTLDSLRHSCALAAGIKGYELASSNQDCKHVRVNLDSFAYNSTYRKKAVFEIPVGGSSANGLKAIATFTSDKTQFNVYSMVAVCRAVFDEIPSHDARVDLSASTDIDDDDSDWADDAEPPEAPKPPVPVVSGTGYYGYAGFVSNGAGLSAGYSTTDNWAFEVGYFNLSNTINMDADDLMEYFVRAKKFYTVSNYFTLGPGYRVAKISTEATKHIHIPYSAAATPGPKDVSGSIGSLGLTGSVGALWHGSWHREGFIVGMDYIGGFWPWIVVRDRIDVSNEPTSVRDDVAESIARTPTVYLLKFNIGYSF